MKHGHGWRRSVSNPKASPVASNVISTWTPQIRIYVSTKVVLSCMDGGPDMVQRTLLLHPLVDTSRSLVISCDLSQHSHDILATPRDIFVTSRDVSRPARDISRHSRDILAIFRDLLVTSSDVP